MRRLGLALGLLCVCWASVAEGECAFVLWLDEMTFGTAGQSALGTYGTLKECQDAERDTIAYQTTKGPDDEKRTKQHNVVSREWRGTGRYIGSLRYVCLPGGTSPHATSK